jgi:hypothetical protein
MKYHFKHIENGQLTDGYTAIQITGHEAEIDPADTEAILLAEKNGGELAPPAKTKAVKSEPEKEL